MRAAAQKSEAVYDIWLDRIKGLRSGEKKMLLERCGSSKIIFDGGAEAACLEMTGVELEQHPNRLRWKNSFQKDLGPAEEQLIYMEKKGIRWVSLFSPDYPPYLAQLEDAPWLLYYRGRIRLLREPGVAVVGTRKGTEYGRFTAGEIGRRLGMAGVTVVSGMAYGADACAHKGALEGGKTLEPGNRGGTAAVLGCGVDICYPKANARLMEQIIREGVALSELVPGTEPRPYFFPLRNRIISGLCKAVVVAEAGLKSGSLITAGLAADQGRDVYAVPGNINRSCSAGANRLIKDGACPVVDLDDLMRELGILQQNITEHSQNQLGEAERKLYNKVLDAGEIQVEQLARELGFPPAQTNALVTILEMKGILQSTLGKILIAKS